MDVQLDVRTDMEGLDLVTEAFVERVLSAAGKQTGVEGEVSVSFVNDEEIHELNRTYRDVDRSTDVLSFALTEGEDDVLPDESELMLGDIVVSIPTALRQASDYGHSATREIAFLLVHGFLHLIGYDHDTEDDEREMFQLQEDILTSIGLTRNS